MIGLMGICMACGSSPIEDENHEQNVEPPDLKNMVFIPAGEFLMGSPEGEGAFDEHPQHEVYLDAYYFDKYEVTNAQFKEFVEATGYVTDVERRGYGGVWNPKESGLYSFETFREVNWRSPNAWIFQNGYTLSHPDEWEYYLMNHPVVQVGWNDAIAYAKWADKRLPTEAEWEKAARGTDGRKWPWGNAFDLNIGGVTVHTNINSNWVLPVDSFPTGCSVYGVYNLIGNAQEWVMDWYAPDYYAHSPRNNPKGPETGKFRVVRGGSWKQVKSYQVLSASRAYQTSEYSSNVVGFRCAWSPSKIDY
jgi:formylglycine-generating enzyme required for sulfatase activity